jgi:hypothetical protein
MTAIPSITALAKLGVKLGWVKEIAKAFTLAEKKEGPKKVIHP